MSANDLTPMQAKFIEFYLSGMTGAAACRKAGYAPKNAAKAARVLLNDSPLVMKAIKAARDKSATKATYNYDSAMKEADECISFAKITRNANAMVKAVEHKAKLSGLLIEKHEIKQTGFMINISGISNVQQLGEAMKVALPSALPTVSLPESTFVDDNHSHLVKEYDESE